MPSTKTPVAASSTHESESETSVTISRLLIPLSSGIALSAFSLPPSKAPCYVHLTVRCHLHPESLGYSAVKDDLPKGGSVNYSELSKALTRALSGTEVDVKEERGDLGSLEDLADLAVEVVERDFGDAVTRVQVTVERPKAVLFADAVEAMKVVRFDRSVEKTATQLSAMRSDKSYWDVEQHTLTVRGIQNLVIIGLNPHEREEEQRLSTDLSLDLLALERTEEYWRERRSNDAPGTSRSGGFDYKSFGKVAFEFIKTSSYKTLETLTHDLLYQLVQRIPVSPPKPYIAQTTSAANTASVQASVRYSKSDAINVGLKIRKPSAIAFADAPVISATRCAAEFKTSNSSAASPSALKTSGEGWTTAYLAIGTNLGDRVANVSNALRALGDTSQESVKLVRTSRLYESEPMYVLDQGKFLNGALEIQTSLSAKDLLLHLKTVEKLIGRVKTIVNGPRKIDLDLLFYGAEQVSIGSKGDPEGSLGDGCGWLQVPHWGIAEREFVLRPLVDIVPPELEHPILRRSMTALLDQLLQTTPASLVPVIPFPLPSQPLPLLPHRPLIMAILNVTPDSFSDGGANRVGESSLETVVKIAKQLVADGADILDIGGMSTRPGVKDSDVSVEEELSRTIPVIQALRVEGLDIPISIDTFRPQVAEEAIKAGASCVNDVRGGRETGMLEAMKTAGVPVIIMHSRGDSTTMTSKEAKDYSKYGGVVPGVRAELVNTVHRAREAGIFDWNVTLDPGVGFAKTQEDNLKLLRCHDELFETKDLRPFSVLVGASRKGFIGNVIAQPDPKQREFGNAAVTALLSSQRRVDIIRVHEPAPTRDVINMTAAIRCS